MKSCLNNKFFLTILLFFLQDEYTYGQPIQLIPHKSEKVLDHPQVEQIPNFQPSMGIWEGTPPSIIIKYFPKIPLRLNSPILRSLRLEIEKEKYKDLLSDKNYQTHLISLLIESGELEQAKEFVLETNLVEKEPLTLDILWLEGESKKACEKIINLLRTYPNLEWKKQNIYCLYLNGEEKRAKIATEVLSESNPAAAQLLDSLFNHSLTVPFNELIAKSPFLLTVWIESQQEILQDEIEKMPPSSVALIARSQKTPRTTRLLAAEKAVLLGTYSFENFVALLKENEQSGYWGKIIEELKSPKTINLLPLFERAQKEQKLGLMGQILRSYGESLEPSIETLPLASFMIRAFLKANQKDLAKKWSTFLLREAPDEAIAVLPLLHFAFPENKWGQVPLQAWQIYESRVFPSTAKEKSYALRHVLEALNEDYGKPLEGEPLPPSWRQKKAFVDEEAATLLESASESKRKGEVLLFVLVLIGETPLHEISIEKFALILKALHSASLQEEALKLALEYLLDKGF